MKLALPVHEGHVSPVFDWARRLLVIIPAGDGGSGSCRGGGAQVCGQVEFEIGDLSPALRARRLAELGVDALLCGGISTPLASLVQAEGVRLIAGLAGEAEAVIDAFLAGALPDPRFALPGWHCHRQRGRSHRHGRRRRGPERRQ